MLIPELPLKTYFYQIYHKFIIANSTDEAIKVFQSNIEAPPLTLAANTSSPIHLVNSSTTIFVDFANGCSTDAFCLLELGSIVQQLLTPKQRLSHIVRIERYIDKGVKRIKIMRESGDQPCYILQNESSYLSVIYKDCTRDSVLQQHLGPNRKAIFGWVCPHKPHVISLQFLWGEQRPVLVSEKEYCFSMEVIERYPPIELSLSGIGYGKHVWVAVESDNNSKILRVRDMVKEPDPNESKVNKVVKVAIASIGISVVSFYRSARRELIYASCEGVSLSLSKGEVLKEVKFEIKEIQVDNQMKADPIFPIMISRKQASAQPFFSVHTTSNLLIDSRDNFYSFERFNVNIVPFLIHIEEDTIIAATEFVGKLKAEESTGEKDEVEAVISVENFFISEIKCNVTYRPSMSANKERNLITKTLSSAFLNLKELPITLKSTSIANVYGRTRTIALMLVQSYGAALESKRSGLVAGMLLSPFTDVVHIGAGVTSFVTNPMAGPKGVVTGTGSLVKGAVAGTFGTVSGVTSAVSQGILALSADEDYIIQRQRADERRRPSNVIEGIGLGLASTFKSVGSGIAGVVTKPIEGASKGGIKGLFKVCVDGDV